MQPTELHILTINKPNNPNCAKCEQNRENKPKTQNKTKCAYTTQRHRKSAEIPLVALYNLGGATLQRNSLLSGATRRNELEPLDALHRNGLLLLAAYVLRRPDEQIVAEDLSGWVVVVVVVAVVPEILIL